MLRIHAQSALQNLVLLLPLFVSGGFLQPRLWDRVLLGYALVTALSVLHAELLDGRRSRNFGRAAVVLYAALIAASALLDWTFGILVSAYTALALFNGLCGRQVVVLDVLAISGAVVLKGMSGVLLIDGHASAWSLIFLFLAACTVALGQRRNELRHEGERLRLVLREYSPKLLDQMLAVVTSSTLVAYSLYALAESGLNVGLVDVGLFRYLDLVYHRDMRCGAELALARDPQLLAALALWLGFAFLSHNAV
jgi:hypothetical protein